MCFIELVKQFALPCHLHGFVSIKADIKELCEDHAHSSVRWPFGPAAEE